MAWRDINCVKALHRVAANDDVLRIFVRCALPPHTPHTHTAHALPCRIFNVDDDVFARMRGMSCTVCFRILFDINVSILIR